MDRRIYENYVIQVAEQGSLTKAASKLGISQPALSAGLTGLEKDLGIKIFNRKSVPISFTQEGRIYYEYIRRSQVLSSDFRKRISNLKNSINNCVSIGAPAAYAESIVTDAVIRLKRAHPEYHVQIKTGAVSELLELVSDGKINCFISTSDSLPENIIQRIIKEELVYLVVPKCNPINSDIKKFQILPGEKGSLFNYSLLDGQEFIFLDDSQPLQKKVSEFLRENSISPSCSIIVDQVATAVMLSLKGGGICFASEEALEANINLDSVYVYALPDSVSGRSIYVAYDKYLYMSQACSSLIQLLED